MPQLSLGAATTTTSATERLWRPLSVEIRGTDLHPEGPPSLVYGGTFALLGIVYGGTGPTHVGLYASPYPHHAWERIDSTRARSDLVFRIRPDLNTRYQLRVEGRPQIRSKVERVYVDLKGKLTATLPKPGVAKLTYIGSGGGAVTPGPRPDALLRKGGQPRPASTRGNGHSAAASIRLGRRECALPGGKPPGERPLRVVHGRAACARLRPPEARGPPVREEDASGDRSAAQRAGLGDLPGGGDRPTRPHVGHPAQREQNDQAAPADCPSRERW